MSFAFDRSAVAALAALGLGLGPAQAALAAPPDLRLMPPAIGTTEARVSDWRSGFGLRGFDPVSYQIGEGPRPGLATHEAVWGGLAWRFASEANRAAFLRAPESFAPRLGGYDAVAIGAGRLATADPMLFLVRDGRLYLFRTVAGRDGFALGAEDAAEEVWARLSPGLVAD